MMTDTLPKIKIIDDKKCIFCLVRRKWIILTPEETVRQYILYQLTNEHEYPVKYISVEKTLTVHQLSKRYDIVVYNQQLQPRILIECKAAHVELKENTLQQIATYNMTLQVPYLVVTNGQKKYCFEIKNNHSTPIQSLPAFAEL